MTSIYQVILQLDEDDARVWHEEVSARQRIRRPLPDGESNTAGAMVAEIIRDLNEYRETV